MLIFLRGRMMQTVYRLLSTVTWKGLAVFILFHFFTSWFGVWLFEPTADWVQPDTFWWFYIVTITTVGYGDFSPAELGSRLVTALYIMPIGISVMGVIIGKIAALFVEVSDKIRRGLMQLSIENHTVVVGDNSERAIELLKNLLADSSVGDVVLLSERSENPLNGRLAGFVTGSVDDEDVQRRACLDKAKTIIVLSDNDFTVMGRTMTVVNANAHARIVAYFQHTTTARNLDAQTAERVCVVTSTDMDVVVQEALDPGAAGFVKQLVHNEEGETYLRLEVPAGITSTFLEIALFLMRQRINPLGLYRHGKPAMCPDPDTVVSAGDVVAVAATNRAALSALRWEMLKHTA